MALYLYEDAVKRCYVIFSELNYTILQTRHCYLWNDVSSSFIPTTYLTKAEIILIQSSSSTNSFTPKFLAHCPET